MPQVTYEVTFDDYATAMRAFTAIQNEKLSQHKTHPLAWSVVILGMVMGVGFGGWEVYRESVEDHGWGPLADRTAELAATVAIFSMIWSQLIAFKVGRKIGTLVLIFGTMITLVITAFQIVNRTANFDVKIFTWVMVFTLVPATWMLWLHQKSLRTHWNALTNLAGAKTLTWDGNGLEIADPSHRSIFKWWAFVRVFENNDVFLLFNAKWSFEFVPKRAFAEKAQMDEFRFAITEATKSRQGAFPVILASGKPTSGAVVPVIAAE